MSSRDTSYVTSHLEEEANNSADSEEVDDFVSSVLEFSSDGSVGAVHPEKIVKDNDVEDFVTELILKEDPKESSDLNKETEATVTNIIG